MSALDEWHREQLSAATQKKLRALEAIRHTMPIDSTQVEAALGPLVAELTPQQAVILGWVLDELDTGDGLH